VFESIFYTVSGPPLLTLYWAGFLR
jgi:hypothetical protein